MALFQDRTDAGRQLSQRLAKFSGRRDVIVLAIPRGGVPVGYEIAQSLRIPMDIYLVRKLGVPGKEELAMGAVASGGARVINEQIVRSLQIPSKVIQEVMESEQAELERREQSYRDGFPEADVRGLTAILVDDGLATGASMQAAAVSLKERGPAHIIIAVPVAPADACQRLSREVDEVVCAYLPEPFYGVGIWYQNFTQLDDEDVRTTLKMAERTLPIYSGHEGEP